MPNGQVRYRFAGFVLDVGERTLHADGRDVYLPPKTFETLRFLVERPGHLVTKTELLDAIWPGVAVSENALTRCIKEVRAALDDDVHAPRCIETVPRVGYRFIAPVEVGPGEQATKAASSVAVESAAADETAPPGVDVAAGAGPSRPDVVGSDAVPVAAAVTPATRLAGAWARWGRHLLTLFTVTGVLVLVPIGSYLATPPGQTMGFGPRDFVLVADLDNQTGEPVFDRSLMTAFTSLLEQSRFANVFPRAGAVATLQRMGKPKDHGIDEETGREICQRDQVRGLVATSIARVGSQYALTARLIEPHSGRVVRSRVEYAEDRDHVLGALETVALELRKDLGESLAVIQTSNHPLQRVTTPSLEALKLYSDGVAMWDKGEHKAALQLHSDAVAKDPGFAAAHAALGAAYYSFVFANRERGQAHFEKALALAGRTTEREQRLIRLSYVHQLGHWDEAYDLYRAYLQSYPDDFRVRHNFAGALRNLSRYEEAAGQYREVLRVAPNHTPAHVNIATCYNPLGKYAEALQHYDRAFELEPSWLLTPNINHEYGFVLVRAGDGAKARATFERALASPAKASALRSIAMLDMYEGKYRDATTRLGEAVALNVAGKNALSEARSRLFLAMALDGRGRAAEARRELALAVKAATAAKASPWVFARIGTSMARLGMVREAAAALEEVRRATDQASRDQLADLHRLEGELASARGDQATAVGSLTLADSDRNSAFTVESLARAHRLAGNRDEAMRWSADLISKVSTATGFEPQQGWLEAHYWLAVLREQAGDRAGAASAAGALLALWHDAEADAPMVKAVRALHARVSAPAS